MVTEVRLFFIAPPDWHVGVELGLSQLTAPGTAPAGASLAVAGVAAPRLRGMAPRAMTSTHRVPVTPQDPDPVPTFRSPVHCTLRLILNHRHIEITTTCDHQTFDGDKTEPFSFNSRMRALFLVHMRYGNGPNNTFGYFHIERALVAAGDTTPHCSGHAHFRSGRAYRSRLRGCTPRHPKGRVEGFFSESHPWADA